MTFAFGKSSSDNLSTCHDDLRRVAKRALGYGVLDFGVTEGHRDAERQKELYDTMVNGRRITQIDGITKKGKHNFVPSLAMDLLPYPQVVNGVNVWQDKQRFCVLAGLIYAAAVEEGVNIRWGGDWDGDGNNADSSFLDLVHFELLDG